MECVICGRLLEHTPRLGEWVAHKKCMDETLVRINEGQERSKHNEQGRIRQILYNLGEMNSLSNDKDQDFKRGYEAALAEVSIRL